jgi:hypothetical protein
MPFVRDVCFSSNGPEPEVCICPVHRLPVERLLPFAFFQGRKSLAHSLHETARIVETEIPQRTLTQAFDFFLKDLDEGMFVHLFRRSSSLYRTVLQSCYRVLLRFTPLSLFIVSFSFPAVVQAVRRIGASWSRHI